MLKIVNIIPSVSLQYGGPSRTAVSLANSLAEISGIKVYFCSYLDQDSRLEFNQNIDVTFLSREKFSGVFGLFLAYRVFSRLLRDSNADIVHLHGVWHPLTHVAAIAARRSGVKYVIHPRGMLEPWALSYKRWRKRLALLLYQKKDLDLCSGFVATSIQEANNLRDLGYTNVVVIPNGVEFPNFDVLPSAFSSKKVLLFMSRVHPKKGVVELVRAWSKVSSLTHVLRIVGPDEGGHSHEVSELIRELGVSESVELVGPRYDRERVSEYLNADVFVLPTYSENFGLVVAEALSYGIPVITTKGAPWEALAQHKCGWWVDVGEQSLVDVLPLALSLSDDERVEMGRRAKNLASSFNWNFIADQTLGFYNSVLQHGHEKTK